MQRQRDILPDRPLPANESAERYVLGSIILNDELYAQAAGKMSVGDFSLESHRRIFQRMGELAGRGETIDRVTLCNELMGCQQLESIGGLSYLVSLDEGLPQTVNVESYIRIVKEKSLARKVITVAHGMMQRAYEDPAHEVIDFAGSRLLELGAERESKGLVSAAQILEEHPGGINALLSPHLQKRGLLSGFKRLDYMTGGFKPGELILLAARPSMGKSAIGLNIAAYLAIEHAKRVAVFSLEMSKEDVLTRLILSDSRIDGQKFRHGKLDSDDRTRLRLSGNLISSIGIWIDDTSSVNVMDINAKARTLQAESGLDLVIVDYIQLMSGSRGNNRNEEVSGISRGLKLMAKSLKVPVIGLSQLSRAPETRAGDHRPQLSDLRDSGSIEQDADMVAFIYREEFYKPDREDLRGHAELLLQKQRNGPTGKIELVWVNSSMRFENRAEDRAEDQE